MMRSSSRIQLACLRIKAKSKENKQGEAAQCDAASLFWILAWAFI